MSRHNKVNKDHYVQRGRLTPDDAARELQKMRQVGSRHTWQPVKKNQLPRFESNHETRGSGTETTEDNGSSEETSTSAKSRAASRETARNMASLRSGPKSTKAKSADAGKAKKAAGKAKTAAGKAKTAKASKAAAKRTASAPKRKAVLARNVGGGGATPRPAAKRRKS